MVAVMVTVVLYQAFWSTLVAQSSCGHWSGTKRRALVVVESAHRGQSALISNQQYTIQQQVRKKESTSSKQHHPRMVVNNVAFRLVVDMVSYDPDQHMSVPPWTTVDQIKNVIKTVTGVPRKSFCIVKKEGWGGRWVYVARETTLGEVWSPGEYPRVLMAVPKNTVYGHWYEEVVE